VRAVWTSGLPRPEVVADNGNGFSTLRRWIKQGLMVATLSVAVGWEAIKAGNPCLSCGYSWYMDCPGVTQFGPDTDIEAAMSDVPDAESADRFVSHLMAGGHDGVIYEVFFRDNSKEYAEKNRETLARLFAGLMRGEIKTTFG